MGLNFQTCTIVNSLKDADSKGKDLVSIEKVLEKGKETSALKIKRDFLFIKDVSIFLSDKLNSIFLPYRISIR